MPCVGATATELRLLGSDSNWAAIRTAGCRVGVVFGNVATCAAVWTRHAVSRRGRAALLAFRFGQQLEAPLMMIPGRRPH